MENQINKSGGMTMSNDKETTQKQPLGNGRFSLKGLGGLRPEPQQKGSTIQKQENQNDSGKTK